MSDDYFHLVRVWNGHNIWHWYWGNPELHKCALNYSKVTVWCSVTSYTITGFHIFENKHHAALTVMPKVTKTCLRIFQLLQWAVYACTWIVPARRLSYLTQLAFLWICCITVFQDDSFLDLDIFLASTVSGPDGPWYAICSCFQRCLATLKEVMWRIQEDILGIFTGRVIEGMSNQLS
jgi:hypothetical protein